MTEGQATDDRGIDGQLDDAKNIWLFEGLFLPTSMAIRAGNDGRR